MKLTPLPRYHGKTEALIREALTNPDLKIACPTQSAADLLIARGIPAAQVLVKTQSSTSGGSDA